MSCTTQTTVFFFENVNHLIILFLRYVLIHKENITSKSQLIIKLLFTVWTLYIMVMT